jgi:hypothetical protein
MVAMPIFAFCVLRPASNNLLHFGIISDKILKTRAL